MTPQSLSDIHTVVIHCSATVTMQQVTAADIDAWHKARGWSMIGYHRVISLSGGIEQGRPFNRRGAHVAGNNTDTLGICLIGGLDADRKPKDTFNDRQFGSLYSELLTLREMLPNLRGVCGHREFSPDLNGDGLITPDEWTKACPCFDVAEKLDEWGLKF